MARIRIARKRPLPFDGFDNWNDANSVLIRHARNDENGIKVAAVLIEGFELASGHWAYSPAIPKAASSLSKSIIFKIRKSIAGSERFVTLFMHSAASTNGFKITLNPTNGIVDEASLVYVGSGWTYVSSATQSLADDFYKITITFTTDTIPSLRYSFDLYNTEVASALYDGDGISGVFLALPNPSIIDATINTAPVFTSFPTITGTKVVGNILTAQTGAATGNPTPTFALTWRRNGVTISGETGPTYLLATADVGKSINIRVVATNSSGSATSYSPGTVAIQAAPADAPQNTVLPVISGSAIEGQVLTASNGTWTGTQPITFTRQWKNNGSDIGSATLQSYTLVAGDVGDTITCAVTADNVAAGTVTATSAGVGPVVAADTLTSEEIDLSVFISPSGNDTIGDGTVALPYLTLTKAHAIIKAHGTKRKIYSRGGDYIFPSSEAFSKAGGDKPAMEFIRYPGEVPKFNAGAVVSWADAGGGIWTATLTSPQASGIDGIVVNDVNYGPSRLPQAAADPDANTDWFHMETGGANTTTFTYKASQISGATQTQLAAAFAAGRLQCYRYGQHGWAAGLSAVSGFNTSTRTVTLASALNDNHAPGARFYFRKVANSASELGEGEWCVIGTELSFKPPPAISFTGANTFIRWQSKIIDINGIAVGDELENYIFRGIEFRNTRWTPSDVSAQSTFKGFRTKNLWVDDCKFVNCGGGIYGDLNTELRITETEFADLDSEGTRGAVSAGATNRNTYMFMSGCIGRRMGKLDRIRGSLGIYGDYNAAYHNLVEDSASQAFTQRSTYSVIGYNEIIDVGKGMDDSAGIYWNNQQGALLCYSCDTVFNKITGKTGYNTDSNGNPSPSHGSRALYYDDMAGGLAEDDRSIVFGNILGNYQGAMINTGNYIDWTNNIHIDNEDRLISLVGTHCIDVRVTRNVYKSSFNPLNAYSGAPPDFLSDFNSFDLTTTSLNAPQAFFFGSKTVHLAQGHDPNSTFGPVTINPTTWAVTSGAPPGWVDIPIGEIGLAGYVRGKPAVFLKGNARYAREPDIVTGGKVLQFIVVGDRWATTLGDDNALTTALLDGITGGGGTGWAAVRTALTHAHVVRTNDHIVTITLPAVASYSIAADETLAITVPASAFQTWATAYPLVFTGTIKEGAWHPTMMRRAMFWNPLILGSITKDGSEKISAIANQGAQTLPFQQNTAAEKPTYNPTGINGKPCIEFPQLTGTQRMALGTDTGRTLNFIGAVFHNDNEVNATSVAEALLYFSGANDIAFHRSGNERVTITINGRASWDDVSGVIPVGDHVMVVVFYKTSFFAAGWHIFIDDMETDLRNSTGGAGAYMVVNLARIGQGTTAKFKGKLGPVLIAGGTPADVPRFRTWVAAAGNYAF